MYIESFDDDGRSCLQPVGEWYYETPRLTLRQKINNFLYDIEDRTTKLKEGLTKILSGDKI